MPYFIQGSAAAPQLRLILKLKPPYVKKRFLKRWIVWLEIGLDIQLNFEVIKMTVLMRLTRGLRTDAEPLIYYYYFSWPSFPCKWGLHRAFLLILETNRTFISLIFTLLFISEREDFLIAIIIMYRIVL